MNIRKGKKIPIITNDMFTFTMKIKNSKQSILFEKFCKNKKIPNSEIKSIILFDFSSENGIKYYRVKTTNLTCIFNLGKEWGEYINNAKELK